MSQSLWRLAFASVGMLAAWRAVACSDVLGTPDIFPADDGASHADVQPIDGPKEDPKNCGRPGHDCLGGACQHGMCQPVTLRSNISPFFITADDSHVFWVDVNARQVARIDKDGGGYLVLVELGALQAPWVLRADEAHVYFGILSGPLARCSLSGCNNRPTVIASSIREPVELHVDQQKVYWVDQDPAKTNVRLSSIDKNLVNSVGSPIYDVPEGLRIRHLVGDSTSLYMTASDGAVRRISKATGSVETVYQGAPSSAGLALDETSLYVTEQEDPGAIRRISKSATNGEAKVITGSQHNPVAVAVDGTRLYWLDMRTGVDGDDGSLKSCLLSSCGEQVSVLASGLHFPFDLILDETSIYWINVDESPNRGAIMKLAKP